MTEQERQEQERRNREERERRRIDRIFREMEDEANRHGGRTFDRFGEPCDRIW